MSHESYFHISYQFCLNFCYHYMIFKKIKYWNMYQTAYASIALEDFFFIYSSNSLSSSASVICLRLPSFLSKRRRFEKFLFYNQKNIKNTSNHGIWPNNRQNMVNMVKKFFEKQKIFAKMTFLGNLPFLLIKSY